MYPYAEQGRRFKHWIERTYGTQKEFAEAIGVKANTLTPYIKGIQDFGDIWLERLKKIGAPLEFILSGNGINTDSYTPNANIYGVNTANNPYEPIMLNLKQMESRVTTLEAELTEVKEEAAHYRKLLSDELKLHSIYEMVLKQQFGVEIGKQPDLSKFSKEIQDFIKTKGTHQ